MKLPLVAVAAVALSAAAILSSGCSNSRAEPALAASPAPAAAEPYTDHKLPMPAERARVRAHREQIAAAGGKPAPSGPLEAWKWHRQRLTDEAGNIPSDGWENGRREREANLAWWRTSGGIALRGGGLSPTTWVSRGPSNVGGRTRSFIIHPSQPARMWAAAVSGGVWYSANSGVSWTPVADAMSNINIGALAFDPTNPDIIYAGTGEAYFGGDSLAGNGLWKSTDAGATWTQLASTAAWKSVGRIAVNPADPQLILVARSGTGAGIMRSTNGGTTWSTVYTGSDGLFVAWDPNNSAKAVAYVYNSGARALYSVNSGANWSIGTGAGPSGRYEMAYAPATPDMVYLLNSGNGLIYRSTNGGQTYTLRTTAGDAGSSWWANPIWVSPTNSDLIVVGGYAILRSINGGQSLAQISNGYLLTTAPHPDIHWFAHDPGFNGTSNKKWWVATDGGIHGTNDIQATTVSWFSRQPSYRTTQFYGVAGHGPTNRIVGGTQDNGTLRINSLASDSANLPFGGDGGWCAIDHENPNYVYGEYVYAQVHRSTNGGASSDYIISGLTDAGAAGNFIAPVVIDPNNPNTLYAGAASLWRTQTARTTATWSSVRPSISSAVAAIAIAPGDSATVWVGYNNGQVWKSTNANLATPTWTAVDNNSNPNPFPARYVTRIYFDPDNASIIYVCLGGFASNNLYRSINGGTNWTDITGSAATGLPSIPIYGIARHPERPEWLYVATELGVFTSNDNAATWSAANEGPANVRCDEIVFMHASNRLLVGTHGRGIYTAEIAPTCPADFDENGFREVPDIFAFLTAWFAHDPRADFDGSPGVDVPDIFAFLAIWFAGCP